MADTKMQVRCTDQEKTLWTGVAGGEGNLSEWVRTQLNAAATPATEKVPHIPNLSDGDVVRDSVTGVLFRTFRIQETLASAPGLKVLSDGELAHDEQETSDEVALRSARVAGFGAEEMDARITGILQRDQGHSVRVETEIGPERVVTRAGDEVISDEPNPLPVHPPFVEVESETQQAYDEAVHGLSVTKDGERVDPATISADDPDDDTAPEPEDPDGLDLSQQVKPVIVPPAPVVPPVVQGEPLSPTCVNAVHHWKLAQGDRCRFCQGVA